MIRQWISDRIASRYPGMSFDVLVPPDAAMGDYSTNIALLAAGRLKKKPHELAQEVCEALLTDGSDRIARCEVAAPGFVNIFLKDAWLQKEFISAGDISDEIGHNRKVLIEYSAPNIAKPMHVGHLRSTIIGDALARVHTALGYQVIRWNYLGDWGTQFGRLIAAFKRYNEPVETVHDMVALYVQFHKELKDHPELEELGRQEFQKLEAGDTENRALWERFRSISMKEYAATYEMLDVSFDVYKGESEYEQELPGVLQQLLDARIAEESEGALVVPLEGVPPGMVRKSDGATLYLTRDIASLEDRIRSYAPHAILYVVANQQALHFEQFFATADRMREAGCITGDMPALVHVKFGLVLGSDGKKFSTREGNAVPLEAVLDEAIHRAEGVVKEKNAAFTEAERSMVARAVAVGALKYNDLRQHPHTDIVFDWDAMLDLGGNSGPYLQYTHARLCSVLAKAGPQGGADRAFLTHPTERALLCHLLDFGWSVAQCAKYYALNGLALYLAMLAEKANRYYEQVRILDDDNAPRKAARLQLMTATAARLREGLNLLGIQAPERI